MQVLGCRLSPALALALVVVVCCQALAASALDPVRELLEEEQYAAAIERLDGAADAESADGWILRSQALTGLGQHKEAVRAAKSAVKAAPKRSDAHLAHAVALRDKLMAGSRVSAMMSIGSYRKALGRALELEPDNVDAREEEIGFLLTAPGIAGGDKEQALTKAKQLTEIDERRGRMSEVRALIALERTEESIEVLQALVQSDPSDEAARWRLANQLQAAERYDEADVEYQHLIEHAERQDLSHASLYQRGRSRVLGSFELDEAVALFERFVAQADALGLESPSPAAAYWRIGLAHEKAGRPDAAATAYRKSLERDAEFERARDALKALGRKP